MIIQHNEGLEETIFAMLVRYYELRLSTLGRNNGTTQQLQRTEVLEERRKKRDAEAQAEEERKRKQKEQEEADYGSDAMAIDTPQNPQLTQQERNGKGRTPPESHEEVTKPPSPLHSYPQSLFIEVVRFSSHSWFGKQLAAATTITTPHDNNNKHSSTQPMDISPASPSSSAVSSPSTSPTTTQHSTTSLFSLPNMSPEVGDDIMNSLQACHRILSFLRLESLLLPTVIYVERFVRTLGRIDTSQIFDLFLTSTILAIKFWNDQAVSNSTFADLFDIPVKLINANEMKFLTVISYNLRLTEDEVSHFKKRLRRP